MDGSYGNVFPTGRAMPPSATAPSSTSQYKVNVSRQKTKKWANFKPQNYDGDDWGDEYDEPAYEPEPLPPPKAIDQRHSPTARQFQPLGSQPLRTQTQQFPAAAAAPVRPGQNQAASGPSSLPSMTQRRATEPIGPAPHDIGAGHAHPVFSPDGRRGSAAPQSARPLPSQLRQAGASARPSDSPKPWMETSSPSALSARSPVSPNKPLPFIRPADVYRRMEEERQKERRSSESGTPGAGNSSVAETRRHGEAQALQPADGADGAAELAPIAERKSEYGIEGILASYRTEEEPDTQPATTQEQVESAESQKLVQSESPVALRRFSRSPQLPDLSRISGFGEDLFSSSLFPASGLRSPVSASFPSSGQVERASTESAEPGAPGTVDPPGKPVESDTHQSLATIMERASGSEERISQPVPDASPSPPNAPNGDQPIGQPLLQATPIAPQRVFDATGQHASAAVSPRQPASRTEDPPATTATRPSMPGGWVTETLPTPGDMSAKATEPKAAAPSVTEAAVQRDGTPLNAIKTPQTESQGTALLKGTDTARNPSPVPSHPASPHNLPPLRTSSPALSTKLGMGSHQTTPKVQSRDASPSPRVDTTESTSSLPASADTEHPELTPVAPLNPRRATPDVGSVSPPVLSLPPFETGPTLQASTDSPVKDSDMLSAEIIKSLSPGQEVASVTDAAEGSMAAYNAPVTDPARESSYLGDVYDDYWATTEDKAEPSVPTSSKTDGPGKAAQDHPPPAPTTDNQAVAGSERGSTNSPVPSVHTLAKSPEDQAETATEGGGLRRRFSWEAALESSSVPVALSSPGAALFTEQKTLGSGADTVGSPTTKLTAPETEPSRPPQHAEGMKSADDLRAESAPELLGPAPSTDRLRESPSPLSVLSDGRNESKRLSLAEEKIVLQPDLPSPPLEQHPVFAATPESRRAEPPIPPSPQNILGFRNIMEMSLASERIKHYNETRRQFSAVDTGLDDWLKAMLSRHPEHANAVTSYSSAAASQTQQGGQGAAPAAGQSARAPAHLPMAHLQHGLGGLGHSSNQMGAKSKELLMAAGKAGKGFGKGLLSKGRNKLRGTGDKVFSSS